MTCFLCTVVWMFICSLLCTPSSSIDRRHYIFGAVAGTCRAPSCDERAVRDVYFGVSDLAVKERSDCRVKSITRGCL